jgi:hypothetical protein
VYCPKILPINYVQALGLELEWEEEWNRFLTELRRKHIRLKGRAGFFGTRKEWIHRSIYSLFRVQIIDGSRGSRGSLVVD